MPPRRILVTGARGFVGGHLLPVLRQEFPQAELLNPVFDLRDGAAVEAAVAASRPDGCVHLAGIAAIADARADPDRAWDVNLHGTLRLARALLRHAPGCRLVFAGSADSYGATFRRGSPLDEDAPLAPLNTYAATKAAADLALGALAGEGLHAVRVRPFNHTGPGQSAAFVVPAFARQAARIAAGRQPPVLDVGGLDPFRDFLDVRDVCRAYTACLRAELRPGEVLNIATGQPRRVGDVLEAVLALAGVDAHPRPDPARLRPNDIPTAAGDPSRARRLLGWTPEVPWEDTLRQVLDDWRGRVERGEDG